MRHRHFSSSFTRSGTRQHNSSHVPMGRAVAPENGPFVGQMDHMSRGGAHSDSRRNSDRFAPVSSGSPVDPYSHSSITENTSLAPVTPGGHIHCSHYNIQNTRDAEAGLLNHSVGPRKRKRSCERGSSSRFCSIDSVSRHPVIHGTHARSMGEGHDNHSRRDTSYSHRAHGVTNFSSRYSRHCSAGGWRSGYRSRRPRIAVERSQPVTEAHPETIMMMDRASFSGSSRNFSDEYRDLRLDIDNMSYEELLNLGERIGNVSTGLSEDSMFRCLTEKIYHSSDQNLAEVSCPICLEEYKKGDKIGMMGKCGHDYHVDCIKKWLLMKKLCPICKSECSTQA